MFLPEKNVTPQKTQETESISNCLCNSWDKLYIQFSIYCDHFLNQFLHQIFKFFLYQCRLYLERTTERTCRRFELNKTIVLKFRFFFKDPNIVPMKNTVTSMNWNCIHTKRLRMILTPLCLILDWYNFTFFKDKLMCNCVDERRIRNCFFFLTRPSFMLQNGFLSFDFYDIWVIRLHSNNDQVFFVNEKVIMNKFYDCQ